MRVNLKTLGCRLNEAELESWARQFQAAGHRVVGEPEQADVIVLNSCAVTEDAVRKSRHSLRKLNRENPRARLVVSGCYATLHPDQAAQALGVDLVVANADKHRLVELAQEALSLASAPAFAMEPGEHALFSLGRQRAFVKVQDGCRYRCTFCIVTMARGEERSRPVADIVAEVNALHRQGIQEAVLTGVHLAGYGADLGFGLEQLVGAVLAETEIPRLRLGSLEPWDLPEDFFALFDNPRLMPHLHLPLQSGSDSVLRRMARRCRSDEFADLVAEARRHIPDVNITTDIIVGFPGETDAEWAESLAFVERMHFGHIHVFGYSPRHGTKAATLPNPVPDAAKKDRSRRLHESAARMKRQQLERHVGRQWDVLWEGYREPQPDGRVRQYGYTPHYLRVATDVPVTVDLAHRLLPVHVERLDEGGDLLIGGVLHE